MGSSQGAGAAFDSSTPRRGTVASPASQLALWTAANLAGMVTALLVTREPFFRRLMNRIGGNGGQRRRRVIRVKRPSAAQSLPMLAQAVIGSSRATIAEVFGPPRSAVIDRPSPDAGTSFWLANTWYYPLPRNVPMAMAIRFDADDYAGHVEFLRVPHGVGEAA